MPSTRTLIRRAKRAVRAAQQIVADTGMSTADLITLPTLSIRTGIGLDRIRRAARGPALRPFLVRCGPLRCVRVADIPRVREVLQPANREV